MQGQREQLKICLEQVYFAKQGCLSLYCGVHSLNNLYGREQFTVKQLNKLCNQLSDDIINPHKHILGGEYDANVMIKALQDKGNTVSWHDSRKQVHIDTQNSQNLVGLLINMVLPRSFCSVVFRTSARHWATIRKIGPVFVLLDSIKDQPVCFQSTENLNYYLNTQVGQGTTILYVTL